MDEIIEEIKEIKNIISSPQLKIYTLNEASKVFGVGSKFLEKGMVDGTLKYVKNGNRTYFTEKAIEEFFECGREYV